VHLTGTFVVIALGVGLVGCGASPGTQSGPPAAALTVTQSDNGGSVALHVGQSLVVQLDSTYWMVSGSSEPAVLAPDGSVQVVPSPGGCVPGQGCGTVTADFKGVQAGSAVVTASRRSCGEALPCAGGQGTFSVAVRVS
jgi:hypothetical protein